jgi:hypothetical protein
MSYLMEKSGDGAGQGRLQALEIAHWLNTRTRTHTRTHTLVLESAGLPLGAAPRSLKCEALLVVLVRLYVGEGLQLLLVAHRDDAVKGGQTEQQGDLGFWGGPGLVQDRCADASCEGLQLRVVQQAACGGGHGAQQHTRIAQDLRPCFLLSLTQRLQELRHLPSQLNDCGVSIRQDSRLLNRGAGTRAVMRDRFFHLLLVLLLLPLVQLVSPHDRGVPVHLRIQGPPLGQQAEALLIAHHEEADVVGASELLGDGVDGFVLHASG